MALEVLAHAIEYLIDTNFYDRRSADPAVQQAIAILKKSSREVFAAAPEMVPLRTRATHWLKLRLGSGKAAIRIASDPHLLPVQ